MDLHLVDKKSFFFFGLQIIDLKAELLRKRNQAEAKSRQNAEKVWLGVLYN